MTVDMRLEFENESAYLSGLKSCGRKIGLGPRYLFFQTEGYLSSGISPS